MDVIRPITELRILMWRGWPLKVEFGEGYWTDLAEHRKAGWQYFILVDDLELEYWRSVKKP